MTDTPTAAKAATPQQPESTRDPSRCDGSRLPTLPILTDEERAKMKRLAESATPGYWVHERPTGNNVVRIVVSGKSYLGIARVHAGLKQEDNAAFIAAANPQTILRYEATIEALLTANASMEQRIEFLQEVVAIGNTCDEGVSND